MESVCRARGITHRRVSEPNRVAFSGQAAAALLAESVDVVLLYFNRIVSAELYTTAPTFNIHPSLLPAFGGLRALEHARQRGVRFVGATMHLVSAEPDAGPIVAQVAAPIWPPCPPDRLADLSFVQRIYLSLLLIDLVEQHALDVTAAGTGKVKYKAQLPFTDRCNPAIQDSRLNIFVRRLEEARGMNVTTCKL